MTLSIRNGLLGLAFGVVLVLAIGYGVLAFALVAREGWLVPVGHGNLFQLVLETAFVPAITVVGFFVARRAYRKSSSPEVFFFTLFLASLAGESLLLAQAWINFATLPAYFTALLTRVVWAFRFSGLFFLLCGSLFSFDFTFRRYGNLVSGSIAAGIFLAAILPLHSTSARNHLLFAVGDAPGVGLATVLLAVVVAVNFLIGSRRSTASDQAGTRAAAAVFYLLAWGTTILAAPWGTLLAIPGIVLTAWKADQNASNGWG